MKLFNWGLLILVFNLFACNSADKKASKTAVNTVKTNPSVTNPLKPDSGVDEEKIQLLIRNILTWSKSKKCIKLIPVITDNKDSLCIGFDLEKVKANLDTLRSTGYFSTEFIDNYDQILVTLDKEMKNKQFAPWSTNELPPFNFANDVDPWCDCQDVPYDTPDGYSLIEVHAVKLNKQEGELYWTWGKLGPDADPSWKKFKYKFKVKKEDGKWKISYLEGFDLNESIKFV